MAISSTKQTEILKIVAGLFNAAPGGSNLSELAKQVEGGMTTSQLADALASIPLFTNGILAGKVTVDDQVNVLMNNFGVTADSDATSAGSQAKAYFNQQITNGVGFGKIVFDAVTFLSATTDTKFAVAQTLLNNKALVAAAYSKTTSSSDLSVLQNVLGNVKGDAPYTAADVDNILAGSGSGGSGGKSFTLTTGTDSIVGTSGNDTILGAAKDGATSTDTLTSADSIDGGAGTDTLKFTVSGDSSANIPVIKNVEVLEVRSTAATGKVDASAASFTKLANIGSSAKAEFANIGNVTQLAVDSVGTNETVFTYADSKLGSTTATLNLALNAVGTSSTNADLSIVTGGTDKVTTLNVAATGANYVNAKDVTGFQNLTKIAVTGAGSVSLTDVGGFDNVATVDASANTGGAIVDLKTSVNAKNVTFTGGSGNDTVKFAAGQFTSDDKVDGGSGNDTLSIADTTISAALKTAINASKNMEALQFTGAGITADVSQFTGSGTAGVSSFSIATAGAVDITQSANGTKYAVEKNVDNNASTFKIANSVGENTTTLSLKGGVTTGTTTFTGISTINVESTGTSANLLGKETGDTTALVNSDNVKFIITGSQDLTMDKLAATTTGSAIDASAFTGKLTAFGSAKGDVITGGSGDDTIDGNGGADVVTGGAGADKFILSDAVYGAGKDIVTIKDMVFKTDSLTLKDQGTETFTAGKIDVSAAGSLAAALGIASSSTDGSTNAAIKWFQYGGNTYLVEIMTNNGAGLTDAATTDMVVKLTGTIDLSGLTVADFSFA